MTALGPPNPMAAFEHSIEAVSDHIKSLASRCRSMGTETSDLATANANNGLRHTPRLILGPHWGTHLAFRRLFLMVADQTVGDYQIRHVSRLYFQVFPTFKCCPYGNVPVPQKGGF